MFNFCERTLKIATVARTKGHGENSSVRMSSGSKKKYFVNVTEMSADEIRKLLIAFSAEQKKRKERTNKRKTN